VVVGEMGKIYKKSFVWFCMRGKRGWVRILEATIAVMIVAGVMLTTYSGPSAEDISVGDYIKGVQSEILSDLVLSPSLRLVVLRVVDDDLSDENFRVVNDYVASEVPEGYGYLLRICDLDSSYDFCKMESDAYVATIDKDVYVEEEIVAAEIGAGEGEEVYDPKKVKVYFWEGDIDSESCIAECDLGDESLGCAANARSSVRNVCIDVEGCLIWAEEHEVVDVCENSKLCVDGFCVDGGNGTVILTCDREVVVESGCVSNFDDECDDHDGGHETGSCGFFETEYECWDLVEWLSGCEEDPVCPDNYDEVGRVGCVI